MIGNKFNIFLTKLNVRFGLEQCYKISQRFKSQDLEDLFDNSGVVPAHVVRVDLTKANGHLIRPPTKMKMYFTSEVNAYGAVIDPQTEPFRFIDGAVKEIKVDININVRNEGFRMVITKVKSFQMNG